MPQPVNKVDCQAQQAKLALKCLRKLNDCWDVVLALHFEWIPSSHSSNKHWFDECKQTSWSNWKRTEKKTKQLNSSRFRFELFETGIDQVAVTATKKDEATRGWKQQKATTTTETNKLKMSIRYGNDVRRAPIQRNRELKWKTVRMLDGIRCDQRNQRPMWITIINCRRWILNVKCSERSNRALSEPLVLLLIAGEC